MIPVSINEYLNKDNAWSSRLLGITDFQKKRDVQQVENEYNLDKYAKLMSFDFKTIEEYKFKEFEQAGLHPITGEMFISKGDDVFKTSVQEARKQYYELIQSRLKKYQSKNICELGCGYGYNLSYLGENAYGGEYSKNAVELGQKLGLEVSEFNYYNLEDYNFIKPESTIFTTHSIEHGTSAVKTEQHISIWKKIIFTGKKTWVAFTIQMRLQPVVKRFIQNHLQLVQLQ